MVKDSTCGEMCLVRSVGALSVRPPAQSSRQKFVDVEAELVTHHRWASLSAEEKRRQVDEAMKACREEIAALIAASREVSR